MFRDGPNTFIIQEPPFPPKSGPALLSNFSKQKKSWLRTAGTLEGVLNVKNATFSVHQLIGNCILPHFYPKIGSLCILEAKVNEKLRTTVNYCQGWCFYGCGGGLVVGADGLVVGGGSVVVIEGCQHWWLGGRTKSEFSWQVGEWGLGKKWFSMMRGEGGQTKGILYDK